MKELDKQQDLLYWLDHTPKERMEAVTLIISQYLEQGQRLDRTAVTKRKLTGGSLDD